MGVTRGVRRLWASVAELSSYTRRRPSGSTGHRRKGSSRCGSASACPPQLLCVYPVSCASCECFVVGFLERLVMCFFFSVDIVVSRNTYQHYSKFATVWRCWLLIILSVKLG